MLELTIGLVMVVTIIAVSAFVDNRDTVLKAGSQLKYKPSYIFYANVIIDPEVLEAILCCPELEEKVLWLFEKELNIADAKFCDSVKKRFARDNTEVRIEGAEASLRRLSPRKATGASIKSRELLESRDTLARASEEIAALKTTINKTVVSNKCLHVSNKELSEENASLEDELAQSRNASLLNRQRYDNLKLETTSIMQANNRLRFGDSDIKVENKSLLLEVGNYLAEVRRNEKVIASQQLVITALEKHKMENTNDF